MSSSHRRETIHVSLGASANAISAHLLNLEGLGATNGTCDPSITHSSQQSSTSTGSDALWTPRVLFVEDQSAGAGRSLYEHDTTTTTVHAATNNGIPNLASVSTWNGSVQVFDQRQHSLSSLPHGDERPTAALHQAARTLAYAPHSRYRQPSIQPYAYSARESEGNNSRHVQWNDEEEEDDDEERGRRQERERSQWQNHTQAPLEEQMEAFWERTMSQNKNDEPTDVSWHWTDFWMPPYPRRNTSRLVLPYSHASYNVVESWDTYEHGMTATEMMLSERLRRILEECDAVQGVTIATQGCGIYAGLTTAILQELQDECRTAGRLVWHVTNSSTMDNTMDSTNATLQNENDDPWQVAHSKRVRRYMQEGLSLHGMTSLAHAVLPLSLPHTLGGPNLFAASAQLALALEASTLSYRLNSSDGNSSKVGLVHGFYGGSGVSDQGYGVAPNLSFGEYLACLQPSPNHCVLELDTSIGNSSIESSAIKLDGSLEVGTSVERRRQQQEGQQDVRRSRNVPPGAWLQQKEGLLRSFSPEHDTTDSRSLHEHFSLTSSFRPGGRTSLTTTQCMTCLIEGMVIPYRPEVSMATVTNESVASLTAGGYGAGSYWKSLHLTPPVLSVVGNTTRSYSYLHSVASHMKQALSPRFRGYRSRDAANGNLPEAEDCEEALQHCFQVRDVYCPPGASGLAVDEEGTYFDES